MKPEQLRKLARTEDAKSYRQERIARKIEKKHAKDKEAQEARQSAIDDLKERAIAVNRRVFDLVKNDPKWDFTDTEGNKVAEKQGHFVVLEPAPKTGSTPYHMAVCVVSYVTPYNSSGNVDPREQGYAQFSFAFVPLTEVETVQATDGYPFFNVIPAFKKDENGASKAQIDHALKINYDEDKVSRGVKKHYKDSMLHNSQAIESMEESLEWVLVASADPLLNSHLHAGDKTQERIN